MHPKSTAGAIIATASAPSGLPAEYTLNGFANTSISRLPGMPAAENTTMAVLRILLALRYSPSAALFAVIAATAEEIPVTTSAYTGMKILYAQLK